MANLGPNARAVKGSISDLAEPDRLYAAVKAERGTLDIVFANAGARSPLPLGKLTAEHIDETFDTNVKGTIFHGPIFLRHSAPTISRVCWRCLAEDIEWIVPGENWPLARTYRGYAGLENLLQKANEAVETSYPESPEFIAQGDRVLVVGFATGKIKATNGTFEDHWVFDIAVRNGKLRNVREPQALTHRHRYHTTRFVESTMADRSS